MTASWSWSWYSPLDITYLMNPATDRPPDGPTHYFARLSVADREDRLVTWAHGYGYLDTATVPVALRTTWGKLPYWAALDWLAATGLGGPHLYHYLPLPIDLVDTI